MLIFVTGGSASGKSEYAGKLAERLAKRIPSVEKSIFYIATLADRSEESKQKVERHRLLRRNGNYTVKECFSLEELKKLTDGPSGPNRLSAWSEKKDRFRNEVVLFDSLDGFTANVFFGTAGDSGSQADTDDLAKETADSLMKLEKFSCCLIVVSDALYSDGIRYDAMTRSYMAFTAYTEQWLADAADDIVEVVCGIPLLLKGENHEFLQIADYNDVSVYENPDASD